MLALVKNNVLGQKILPLRRHILFQLSKSLDPSLKQPHEKIALFRGFSSNGILKSANNPDQMKARQEALMKRGLPKKKSIPGVKHIVLISSGKGGVGKSTTSVNLAIALSKHKSSPSVGILDADIFGPSLPTMMNISCAPELTPEKKMIPVVNFGIKCMSIGLLIDPEQAVVWRGPMVMGALGKLMNETDWGGLDVLVVDTPPGTGDILLSLAQSLNISGAIIVSTPQKVALADAVKGIDMFKKVGIPVLGMVENMSGFICGSCGSLANIFGKEGVKALAEKTGISVIGSIPLDPSVMECSDTGKPLLLSHPNFPVSKQYNLLADIVVSKLDQ